MSYAMCRGVVGFVKGSCRARQVKKATLWSALSCKHRCRVCHTVSVMTGCYNTGLGTTFPEFEKPRKPTHSSLLSSRCSVGAQVSVLRFASADTRRLRGLAMEPPALLTCGLRPAGCCLFGGEGWACAHSSWLLGSGPTSCLRDRNQWQSVAISGHLRSSTVISGPTSCLRCGRHSGNQWSSAVISGHQRSSCLRCWTP